MFTNLKLLEKFIASQILECKDYWEEVGNPDS